MSVFMQCYTHSLLFRQVAYFIKLRLDVSAFSPSIPQTFCVFQLKNHPHPNAQNQYPTSLDLNNIPIYHKGNHHDAVLRTL